jgi:hypothetical protein
LLYDDIGECSIVGISFVEACCHVAHVVQLGTTDPPRINEHKKSRIAAA